MMIAVDVLVDIEQHEVYRIIGVEHSGWRKRRL